MVITFKYMILIIFSSILFSEQYNGYLYEIEMSFCMDDCSYYYLESEEGEYISNISFTSLIDPTLYINRFVQIEGQEIWCIECGAIEVEYIELSTECNFPVSCFVDPCEVANGCQIDTSANCISNYCGSCYADFYDSSDGLIDCYNSFVEPCEDLGNIFFGLCDMYLGVAIIDGLCQNVSGCDWIVNEIDYSDAFFTSFDDCEFNCLFQDSCEEIVDDYNQLHNEVYNTCDIDSDCLSIWGDCGIGLGDCHYSINELMYNQMDIDLLVDLWLLNNCIGGVCDCLPLPDSYCNNGLCELGYCLSDNPSGCVSNGCPDNFGCVDYEYTGDCISSSCFCDEFYNDWFCTEDCNGGSCYEFGDVSYDGNLNVVDAVLIIDMILNLSTTTLLSDINSDGLTNIVDIVLLVNIILD